jgi:hypothetical protein
MKTISEIIGELVERFDLPAHLINSGKCRDFAEALQREFPDGKVCPNDFEDGYCYHVSFLWNDRFYDAECPEGVEDWRNLPCMKRYDAVLGDGGPV